MIKLIKKLLNASKWVLNNKGLAPWIIPAAVSVGSTLLGRLGSKKDEEEEGPSWYTDPWTEQLRKTITPKLEPSYYDIPQTGVEAATTQRLLGRLGRGVEDIKPTLGPEAATPYYEAEKERRKIGYGEEETYIKDILQKEGMLTSTPGAKALTDLKARQTAEMGAFGEKLMYEDIRRDIEATTMAENIIAQTLSQGTLLGGTQRQALQWPYTMAQGAMGQARGLESTGVMPEEEGPSVMEELGGAGQNIGQMMLMMELLKGLGGGAG